MPDNSVIPRAARDRQAYPRTPLEKLVEGLKGEAETLSRNDPPQPKKPEVQRIGGATLESKSLKIHWRGRDFNAFPREADTCERVTIPFRRDYNRRRMPE